MDLRIQSGIRLCHIDFIKILMILILMGMFPSGSVIAGYLTLPITGDFPITYSFEDPKYQRHKGTDYGTPTGSDIIAPYKGTVIDTSPIDTDIPNSPGSRSYGNFIKIDHGLIDGKRVYTIYGHLLYGSFLVKKGSKVLQGQQLAKSGNSGDSTGPHLHFEVRVDGKAKDPYDTNAYLWTKNPPSHSVYIPARCLIQLEGDGTVYWLQNEKKYPISVPAIIDTMENAGIENWGWGKIITVFDVSKYATGPNVLTSTSASDNLLIKDIATNRIYKMKDGVKEYQSTLTNFADVIDMASDFFNITAHESYMVGQLAPNAIIKQEFVNIYDLNVSELGLPTDVVKQTESITGEKGFYQTFDNGSIQYTASGVNAGSGFAVYGKIYNKWALLRYADSPLGLPIDNQTTTFTSSQGTTGFYQSFERGSIQVNINNNQEYAYAVYDEIYNKWGQLNFAAGDLGLPVGDIINHARSGFGTLGYYQRFENGTIQVVNNSVYAVDGIIYREWGNQGYAGKSLPGNDIEVNQTTWAGFPISDPYTWNGNLRQNFEGGYIVSDGTAAEFISDKHPNNLTASKISSNTIHLAWENRINTDWVNIYRFSSPAELIDTVAGDITSYDDTILTDHAYTYYLQAANETSESPPSNLFSVNVSKTTVILSYHSPDLIIAVGSNKQVYGTSASNQVTLESGAKAEMINFPGHNIINIQSSSDLFSVSRSGTVVTFQGSDGTLLKIPATTDIQTISFNGEESRVLQMYNNLVMLDDQVITTTAAAIEGQKEQAACGAYIAPGVWKEFDCYNLAAIGKDLGHDPFTPSWRLIGGYWQWGRKGPSSSQWYDTNTEHFAHGPTGPGLEDANSDDMSNWDTTYAPNGSWTDAYKNADDPCPVGYRVPTQSQWQGVIDNNTQSVAGTWSTTQYDFTNYSSARFFGDNLMLPTAGVRHYSGSSSFSLYGRGYYGNYWSSTEKENSSYYAWPLHFHSSQASTNGAYRKISGFSVRCVAE